MNSKLTVYYSRKWSYGAIPLAERARAWSFSMLPDQEKCFSDCVNILKYGEHTRESCRSVLLNECTELRENELKDYLAYISRVRGSKTADGNLAEHLIDDSLSIIHSLLSECQGSSMASQSEAIKNGIAKHFSKEIEYSSDFETLEKNGTRVKKYSLRRIPLSQGMLPEEAKALDIVVRRHAMRTIKIAPWRYGSEQEYWSDLRLEAMGILTELKGSFDPNVNDNFVSYVFSYLPKRLIQKKSIMANNPAEFSIDALAEGSSDKEMSVDDIMSRLLFEREVPSGDGEDFMAHLDYETLVNILKKYMRILEQHHPKAFMALNAWLIEEKTFKSIAEESGLTVPAIRARAHTKEAHELLKKLFDADFLSLKM